MSRRGVLFGTVIVIILLGWLLRGSALFAIKEISIEGGERVKPAEVQSLIGIRVGENIFAADLRGAEEALLRLPWVRRALVRRALPSRIIVSLEERRPFAVVSSKDRYYWVDREGYLLERANAPATDKPLLSDVGMSETERGPRLDARSLTAFQALYRMDENFLDRFSQFSLHSDSPELILQAKEGFEVRLDLEDLAGRLELLERLLTVIDGSHYLYIDLRFGDLVMLPR
ncbi:MAG: cell division protein FtsQ/DivIB [Candidatus Bipolaricaulia bacterium]